MGQSWKTIASQILTYLARIPAQVGGKLPVDATIGSSALPTGAATEQGLDDILAKLSADPATQTTLAAILAKIIAAPATEAKQLADGHNVTVDNAVGSAVYVQPGTSAEFPLPAAQVSTLTPPAAITGFATSDKQPALEGTDKAKVSLYVKKSANGDSVLTLGKTADADSLPVTLSTETIAALVGLLTSSPASITLDEDGTARNPIELWKAIKNMQIDGNASLVSILAQLVTKKVQLHANIDISQATAYTAIAAPSAGYRIRLTQLCLMSGAATPVNSEIGIKSASTLLKTVKGAAIVLDFPEHCNLGTAEALVLLATTADRIVGGVDYYVEAI